MDAVAIIPAYNEAATIGPVVRSVVASGLFRRVLVVSDGSRDETAERAREAGAEVLELQPNRGKGGAMLAALDTTSEPIVCFFDADLKGFRSDHCAQLLGPFKRGPCAMVCGLRDKGPRWNMVQRSLPPITGERAVLRSVLSSVPREFWSGFRIEAGINEMAFRSGLPCYLTVFDGVSIREKWDKVGLQKGVQDMVRMSQDVLLAMDDAQRITPSGQAQPRPAEVTVLPDGSVRGLDGLLNQVAGAVARSVRQEIYPTVAADRELQQRVGHAAGAEIARSLFVPACIVAGAAVVGAAALWRSRGKCSCLSSS